MEVPNALKYLFQSNNFLQYILQPKAQSEPLLQKKKQTGGKLNTHVICTCTHIYKMSVVKQGICTSRFILPSDFSGSSLIALWKPRKKPFGLRSNTGNSEMSCLTEMLTESHQGHLHCPCGICLSATLCTELVKLLQSRGKP